MISQAVKPASETAPSLTDWLLRWRSGEQGALDEIIPRVYDHLCRIASRQLRAERRGHTLDTSALVHEAYLRLVDQRRADWRSRAQFFSVAARLMRRILVDHARRVGRLRRGADTVCLAIDEAGDVVEHGDPEVLRVHEALVDLERENPELARLAEMRFFGGMTQEEIAEVFAVTPMTIHRRWRLARAWLHEALGRAAADR